MPPTVLTTTLMMKKVHPTCANWPPFYCTWGFVECRFAFNDSISSRVSIFAVFTSSHSHLISNPIGQD